MIGKKDTQQPTINTNQQQPKSNAHVYNWNWESTLVVILERKRTLIDYKVSRALVLKNLLLILNIQYKIQMQESVCVYFSRLAINDSRITIVVATTPVLEHT